jgi:hypothetical protein
MGSRWVAWLVCLLPSVTSADGSFGTPVRDELDPAPDTRFTRLASEDGGVSDPLYGNILTRSWQTPQRYARTLLLYVGEVRTPGSVTLRLSGTSNSVSILVAQPGWHEWVLPSPVLNASFELDTLNADVTFKYTCFDDRRFYPSEEGELAIVRMGQFSGRHCTGLLRMTGPGDESACPAPEDDRIGGIPYVETPLLPAGTYRQRVRVSSNDWFFRPTPLGISRFDPGPQASRIFGADGGLQTPNLDLSYTYPVTDVRDGGLSSPFVLEFESDGSALRAAITHAPSACHPAARASVGGEESKWIGGPLGADLSFRVNIQAAGKQFLDRDGDGFAGSNFEWRLYPVSEDPTDCDDDDPARSPIATERCNGLDDDCDGTVDGTSVLLEPCERTSGVCRTARRDVSDCQNGTWLSCEARGRYPLTFRAEEDRCDGLDEDCDGTVDDAPPPVSCPLTQGVCSGSRTQTCTAASWAACDYGSGYELTESSCDGLDNDCDGLLDAADLDVPQSACELQQGVCANAVHARTGCTATGWASCTRTEYGTNFQQDESRCDGLDNDCDGLTDADDTDLDDALCEKQLGVCAGAKHVRSDCSAGSWKACAAERLPTTWEATESRCDGLDNDCDGVTDEGCRAATPPSVRPKPTNQSCTCATAGGLEWMLALIVLARAARPRRARTDRAGGLQR